MRRLSPRETTDDPSTHPRILDIVGPELNRASVFVALLGEKFGPIPSGQYDSLTALELYRAIASPSMRVVVFRRAEQFPAELAIEHPEIVKACVLVATGAKLSVAQQTLETVQNNWSLTCTTSLTVVFG